MCRSDRPGGNHRRILPTGGMGCRTRRASGRRNEDRDVRDCRRKTGQLDVRRRARRHDPAPAVAPDCNSYTLEIDLYDANDVNEGNWTQTDLIEQKLDRKGKGPYKVVVTRHDVKPNMTTYLPAVYAIAVFNLSSPAGEDIPCGVTQEELAPDLDTGADGAGMDVFKFDGKAGDRILLSAIPYYDADKLRLSLYDANNVREGNWTQTDLIGYKLQGKGPYRIVVIRCDDDLDLPTNYNITLFNLSSCKGTPISYQSTLGNRPLPCDGIDVFTFNGKPEDKIVLHATVIDRARSCVLSSMIPTNQNGTRLHPTRSTLCSSRMDCTRSPF